MSKQPEQKRVYRKGNPLSAAEHTRRSVEKKRNTLKEIKIFVSPDTKIALMESCKDQGKTQAEIIEELVRKYIMGLET